MNHFNNKALFLQISLVICINYTTAMAFECKSSNLNGLINLKTTIISFDTNLHISFTKSQINTDSIFTVVEKNAMPEGGMRTFYKFLSKRIKFSKKQPRMPIGEKVYVQFVVEKNGDFSNIKVIESIGARYDEEVIRVIKLAPKWIPAKQGGVVVRQKIVIPINFRFK